MTDYVDRNKVLSGEEFFGEHATWDNPMAEGCLAVRSDFIVNLPAADVVEVRHGKWEYIGGYGYQFRCSECILCAEYKTKYCPNCGAKMDGGQDE